MMSTLKKTFLNSAGLLLGVLVAVGCGDQDADIATIGKQARETLKAILAGEGWNYDPFDFIPTKSVEAVERPSMDSTQRWFTITVEVTEADKVEAMILGSIKSLQDQGMVIVKTEPFKGSGSFAPERDPKNWAANSIVGPAKRIEVQRKASKLDDSLAQGTIFVFSSNDNHIYVARWNN